MWENTEKIGSSNFTVDIRFTKKFQERNLSNKTFDRFKNFEKFLKFWFWKN